MAPETDKPREAAGATAGGPPRLSDLVTVMRAAAEDDDVATVDEVLTAFGPRAYGPMLALPALIAIAPVVGALPGVSLGTAAIMVLIAGQLALGRREPWVPERIRRLGVSGAMARRAADWIEPALNTIAPILKPRWRFLTGERARWGPRAGVGLACLMAALLACVGALIPGGVVPPALVVLIFGLGLMVEDGLVLAMGLAGLVAILALGVWWLLV
ncbi:MAG: exopolysaccharide biosynthesis protein [Maricaulaceae bacterium]